jgi:phosphoribosylaminoimidazolecarboxamide formyltransferase/IMP cyclohydrolase
LIAEFKQTVFAVIKHTNVCGVALRNTVEDAWEAALAGDPESAFGGVLATNARINMATAQKINEIFFEVLIAPAFDEDALALLKSKKNRILLLQKAAVQPSIQLKNVLNGTLSQDADTVNFEEWNEVGARVATEAEQADLRFANIVCKHLKSNAIALAKNEQLIGKGCGQTSRIDALRQALEKARQFGFELKGSVLASDAFFPFADGLQILITAGITAVVSPGGSVRDEEVIAAANQAGISLYFTGTRHFSHA